MKAILEKYAAYNKWANGEILATINHLKDEQIHQEIESSFSSLYKTVLHLLDAESIWWQRLHLAERIEVPGKDFSGSFAELSRMLLEQCKLWEEWVKDANGKKLEHVFAYQNSRKEQFKQPVNEVLLHLLNHGTYHRGQLVTMLRQLGVDRIPQTDFAFYVRK